MSHNEAEGPSLTKNGNGGEAEISPLRRFLFVKPILGWLLVLIMVMAGWMAYTSLVKEAMPNRDIPQATVVTEWAGADPDTIEKQVTNKIERKLKSLKGLKRLRSASFNSFSVIAVEFRAEADIPASMQLLRSSVSQAEPDLPKEAKKPKIEQVSVDDSPVLTFSLYGDVPLGLMSRTAEKLKERLKRVSGVRDVKLGGRRKEVVWVELYPNRLAELGVSPTSIGRQIKEANLDTPWGAYESRDIGMSLKLYGRFRTVDDLAGLPVARLKDNRVVFLKEAANVRIDLEKEKSRVALSYNGSPFQKAVDISVLKSAGYDTLKLIEQTKAVLTESAAQPQWPHGLKYVITSDQSIYIWQKLKDVFNNGWQAMLAVFVVLFFALTWREALVAGLSIPITFLGALAVIWALGYTLNEMVIIGMVLALGLLVDVFILMLEGMHDGIFNKKLSFTQAAINTVKTYGLPAFAGQMTTIVAMVPLFGIGGMDGKFIRIIPITVIVCLVISFIVALLVDIPLSRYVLPKDIAGQKPTFIDRLSERAADYISAFSLKYTVRNRGLALVWVLGAIGLFLTSAYASGYLPSLLYPKADGRKLGVTVELPPDSTLEEAQETADELGEILRRKTYFESVVKFTGQKSPLALNSIADSLTPSQGHYIVGFSCVFTPRSEREHMAFQYLDELRSDLETALRNYPGSQLSLTADTGGSSTEDPIQIYISGDNLDTLRSLGRQVQAGLRGITGAVDVRDNLGQARMDARFIPRREALDFHNISQSDLSMQVRMAMTDDEIGKFPVPGTAEDLEIRLGMIWPSRKGRVGGPTKLEEFTLVSVYKPDGTTIPLGAVMDAVVDQTPLAYTHKGGRRNITVLAKTDKRTVGQILDDFKPELEKMKEGWPNGYDWQIGGEAESTAETYADVGKMLIVAILLVFALLALQFGSFSQPFIIMLSLPFAMIGVLGGFFLTFIPFSFPAMIGIIALVGIVVNDAIVMVDTMNGHLKSGRTLKEAAARGAAERVRPIISTTVTTVAGLIPLALSSPMWMPLCNAIIFGLLAATFVSQLIIPCLYLLLTGQKKRMA